MPPSVSREGAARGQSKGLLLMSVVRAPPEVKCTRSERRLRRCVRGKHPDACREGKSRGVSGEVGVSEGVTGRRFYWRVIRAPQDKSRQGASRYRYVRRASPEMYRQGAFRYLAYRYVLGGRLQISVGRASPNVSRRRQRCVGQALPEVVRKTLPKLWQAWKEP